MRGTALLTNITFLRIVLVPFVMLLVLAGPRHRYAYGVAAGFFAVAAATDFVDGYLARRWRLTTTMGAFLDTTADKLLVSGVLVALVAVGRVSVWITVILIGREFLILGLRGVVVAAGTPFPPSIWGKLKANVQFAGILLAIVRYPHPAGPLFVDQWVMLAAAAVTVASAAEYLVRFWGELTGRTGT
ncbi:MAG: CDP-diacylglycerol---glycerol-3-phosphate 3-phosphatidyltransferase [Actinomycetota bacterium]|jgi:CDP-diacylglycerol--glycerol-3-phosphate 3-phosphatidyltransferase|nr:CDP-diacylglycerol---glycerol-3-phosphate 3-phosphatidyltransferase [Actinomycetota bacterium]MEA2534389.1 CDP-diacylglycerol---glycerol-3-phosphate 3-phosphatidyltransferase [Actinomycetota bacterium]MEA2567002.1 CDP-diacylglycerol---glycerol-3-phosphate 3-phosphatidyltransferase [Actinomycetota bacterium]